MPRNYGLRRCEHTRKLRYRSHEHAVESLHAMATTTMKGAKRIPIRSYYCVHCKGWHVTSQEIAR